jgi:hypothetical protein
LAAIFLSFARHSWRPQRDVQAFPWFGARKMGWSFVMKEAAGYRISANGQLQFGCEPMGS